MFGSCWWRWTQLNYRNGCRVQASVRWSQPRMKRSIRIRQFVTGRELASAKDWMQFQQEWRCHKIGAWSSIDGAQFRPRCCTGPVPVHLLHACDLHRKKAICGHRRWQGLGPTIEARSPRLKGSSIWWPFQMVFQRYLSACWCCFWSTCCKQKCLQSNHMAASVQALSLNKDVSCSQYVSDFLSVVMGSDYEVYMAPVNIEHVSSFRMYGAHPMS